MQFVRYMNCMRRRVDRLNSGRINDERLMEQDFSQYEVRYHQRRAEHAKQQFNDPMLDHYRWMLEEFRVSLFASKLGTAIKVDGRKLDEQWERVS